MATGAGEAKRLLLEVKSQRRSAHWYISAAGDWVEISYYLLDHRAFAAFLAICALTEATKRGLLSSCMISFRISRAVTFTWDSSFFFTIVA